MKLSNFLKLEGDLIWDGDEELIEEIASHLDCSPNEIYVVGVDNDEQETESISYRLQDYFSEDYQIIFAEGNLCCWRRKR